VKKAACLAIPKVYSLDPDLKEELIGIIESMLCENNIMVLGAAVFAYSEVCPDQYEILHEHYRKICKFLIDCDEWSQILMLTILTRYARSQFLNPIMDGAKKKTKFYSDEEEDGPSVDIDPDHRLLIKSSEPLLKSSNSAVIII
jgi:AP-3 complex subunit beta